MTLQANELQTVLLTRFQTVTAWFTGHVAACRCDPSAPALVASRAEAEVEWLTDSGSSLVACAAFFEMSEMEYARVRCGRSGVILLDQYTWWFTQRIKRYSPSLRCVADRIECSFSKFS